MGTTKRYKPYVYVTWITKLIAGEKQCLWELWFQANYKFDKKTDGAFLEKWVKEHDKLTSDTVAAMKAEGFVGNIYLENDNHFTLTGSTGAKLQGKADIVTIDCKEALVVDSKTGSQKISDTTQVLIYMFLLPICIDAYKGFEFRGRVVYSNNRDPVDISQEDLSKSGIKEDIIKYMKIATGSAPAKSASHAECRFCKIPKTICKERVDENPNQAKTGLF